MEKITWTNEETKLLVIKVFKAVKRGLPIDIGFEWTFNKLDGRSLAAIRSHWYLNLNNKYKEKLAFYKKGVYVQRSNGGQWSKKDDQTIITTVKESIVTGKSLSDLFTSLANKLDRTQSAIQTRWYKVLSKKKSIISEMEQFELELRKAV
ncbi:hypothetical protein D3C81_587390 [compost metagenome]